MKKLIFATLLILLTTSCGSTFYFSKLDIYDSKNETIKTHTGDFVFDNDTVNITYAFNGFNAPLWISIYNKHNKPIIVDWEKSFLIIDNHATTLAQQGSFSGLSHNIGISDKSSSESTRSYSESIGRVEGNINIPQSKSYVPPRTKIEFEGYRLQDFYFDDIKNNEYSETTLNNKKDKPVKVKSLEFTPYNTLFHFRSYLTFYTEEAPDKPFVQEEKFFISNLYKTNKLNPENVSQRISTRGDMFFSGGGSGPVVETWQYIVGGVAVGGLLIWSIIEMSNSEKEFNDFKNQHGF